MTKKCILALLGIFVTWGILDYIMHGVILSTSYQQSSQLWRPMAEMNICLMYLTNFVHAIVFVAIYLSLIDRRSLRNGLWFGLLYGIGMGISMGYGSYSVMPIPTFMAHVWFVGTVIEALAAGGIVGLLL